MGPAEIANPRLQPPAPATGSSRRLRLPLVAQLALLLVGAVLLAVTALGSVVAWNLRAGFSDYLRTQDDAYLHRFAEEAGRAVARGGLEALSGPGRMRPILDAVAQASGAALQVPVDEGPPPRGAFGPRPGPGPGARPPTLRASSRIGVVDLQGRPLTGRPVSEEQMALQRPILMDGQAVAYARMLRLPLPTEGIDAAFLTRQYQGIGWTALVLVLLAIGLATWVGQRWLRPVRAVQQAAQRLARGEHDVQLATQGHDELSDLSRDIQAMAQSLAQLETSRRRWIAQLSHEMRTPLAVLRAETESLVDGVRVADAAALQSLQEEVARVTRVVDDFHQLALSDLRALPCTMAAADAGLLLQQTVQRFAGRAQAAGIQLSSTVDPDLPQAYWDAQRIGQLMSNLMENGLRYTDAPGQMAWRLACSSDGRTAELSLDDSPPGVPPQDLNLLFEPLYRADPSRSRLTGGSGLGLAICRAIVLAHQGRIAAEPSTLGGLCIRISLPWRVDDTTTLTTLAVPSA